LGNLKQFFRHGVDGSENLLLAKQHVAKGWFG
jgi:hypothetical protein